MTDHERNRLARRAYWIDQQQGACGTRYRIYTHPALAAFTSLEREHAQQYRPKGR